MLLQVSLVEKRNREENHLLQWSFEVVVVWLRKIQFQVKVNIIIIIIITLCLRKFIELIVVLSRYFNFNNPLFWIGLDVRDSKESEEL